MIDGALFDWGGTLSTAEWNDERNLRAGRAGLEEIGRKEVDPRAVIAWFAANEELFRLDDTDEIDLVEITRACLHDLDCPVTDAELDAYMTAWHGAVASESHLHADALELLGELRARGLRIGLISNTFSPGRFLVPQLRGMGLEAAVDVVVLSSDHGKRKPHAAIFEAALAELGVAPERALFVGDRFETDITGAREVGMTTVQATWFREESPADGLQADFVAREPLEVLDILDRCLSASRS